MKNAVRFKQAVLASAVSLALAAPLAHAADGATQPKDSATTNTSPTTTTTNSQPTGKEKATAIGAGTGAVAGAVVGGPVGALVGAGIGGYVGHEGTDANGHVANSTARSGDGTVKKAQAALKDKGYNLTIDGRNGPSTQNALRDFQTKNGLTASGTLDDSTMSALGLKS